MHPVMTGGMVDWPHRLRGFCGLDGCLLSGTVDVNEINVGGLEKNEHEGGIKAERGTGWLPYKELVTR